MKPRSKTASACLRTDSGWKVVRALAFAMAALCAAASTPAWAVHDNGEFELDRNAIDAGATSGDDWDTEPSPDGGAFEFTGIIADPVPEASIFTTGKSKDDIDVSQWKWKSASNILDKNNITNAYAAAYSVASNPPGGGNDLVIYFGLDRFSNDGSAQVGFWFFKGDVSLNPNGTFNGTHQDGDVLVQSNFSNGGVIATVTVYKWENGGLVQIASGGDCLTSGADDNVCATVNQESTMAPWPYAPKPNNGPPGFFPQGAFFEGGINLSGLGLTDTCFSTFLAETRSSTPFDAVLKDFVGPGEFDTCNVDVTKTCANPRLNDAQDMIVYDISGRVTAESFGGALFNVGLTDNPAADGPFNWVDCDDGSLLGTFPLDSLSGDACYTNTMTVPLDMNGTSDTVTVTGNTAADGSGTALTDQATAECPNLMVSPAIMVTKDCAASVAVMDNKVVAQVNISGKVCNIGDSNLTDVQVDDLNIVTDPDPLVSGVTLLTPADPAAPTVEEGACVEYQGSYLPSAAVDNTGAPTNCPSDVVFKDTVEATATDIFGMSVTPHTDMAECKLCPEGGCDP